MSEFRHQVTGSMAIEAPAESIWQVLADFHQVRRWAKEVTHCVPLGDVTSGIGSGRRCEIRGVGSVDEYIDVWQPHHRFGYSVSRLGPVAQASSRWQLEPAGAGTQVTLSLHYNMRFGPLGRLLNRIIARRRLEQSIPGVLKKLRRFVEENHGANGGQQQN